MSNFSSNDSPQPTSESPASRGLSADEQAYIAAARDKAHTLYLGEVVAHRSCGIALAETFGLPSRSYQALRRGGISGEGACGAIRAGEQLLGELLGDPDPAGAVTAELRAAIVWYQQAWKQRLLPNRADIVCNNLVRSHGEFMSKARVSFCTSLAAGVAELAAEALIRFSQTRPPIEPVVPVSKA